MPETTADTTPETIPDSPASPPPQPDPGLKLRILRQGKVRWRDCRWFQPEGLRKRSHKDIEDLADSLLANGLYSVWYVWRDAAGTDWILDAHGRDAALRRLVARRVPVPEELDAVWIDAPDREAAKRAFVFLQERYGGYNENVFLDFVSDLDLDLDALRIPELDLKIDASLDDSPGDDELPEYPIVAKYSEAYNAAVIFCRNEIDWNQLCELLGLEKARSYKCKGVGLTQVIDFADFAARWQSRPRPDGE